MSKSYRRQNRYSKELKLKACEVVMSGEMTLEQCAEHYGIKSGTSIWGWLRTFGFEDTTSDQHSKMSKDQDESPEVLQQRIKQLEKQLKLEKIRSEGLNFMIDWAEKEYNAPIRKKVDTKQSKK